MNKTLANTTSKVGRGSIVANSGVKLSDTLACKRRFFYHYYKQKNCMTVHWRGACYPVQMLYCYAATELKRNNRQPRVTMQGWAHSIRIENGICKIWE